MTLRLHLGARPKGAVPTAGSSSTFQSEKQVSEGKAQCAGWRSPAPSRDGVQQAVESLDVDTEREDKG